MFQTKVVEKKNQNMHFIFRDVFQKSYRL